MADTMMYQRDDWTDFRNLATLTRRAGVPAKKLPRVVLKELVDNALDHAGMCRCDRQEDGTFHVEDAGEGIAGTPEEIAMLFSIGRPLTSSKLLRLPTRGALGNGLRVVVGAVLSTGGSLVVRTRGQSIYLTPQDDGTTAVERVEPWDGTGTRVEVRFGPGLGEVDGAPLSWASWALRLANKGSGYKGKSSPFWFDADSFWDLFQAAGNRTVRDQIAQFDGCGEPKAGQIAEAYLNRRADSLRRDEAEDLLRRARQNCKAVTPFRLGEVGPLPDYPGYKKGKGEFAVTAARGTVGATIPAVIEAWARQADRPQIILCINRTPTTADLWLKRNEQSRTEYTLFGCNLYHSVTVGQKRDFQFLVNVQAPYLSLTTDGKEPDLHALGPPIVGAMERAARRATKILRKSSADGEITQKSIVIKHLPAAIAWASGNGASRYGPRTLFYYYRPKHLEVFTKEPLWGTFNRIITEYEDEIGHDLPGIARDNRGVLIHPHSGEQIQLGTLSVEKYQRPQWQFNKILYCEKEGLFPVLRDARWPERHDCALLTSKGFATRAARDVLDLLGDTDEPLTFFCIHDADASGTLIWDKLQNATKARPARTVQVINLGLEPKEALAMGLRPEPVEKKKKGKKKDKRLPVGAYVRPRREKWLQKNRCELNGMNTPQLLKWLDAKMKRFDGKLVPPEAVLSDRLEDTVRQRLREAIKARVLAEADVEGQVQRAVRALLPALQEHATNLEDVVQQALAADRALPWGNPVDRIAAKIVEER